MTDKRTWTSRLSRSACPACPARSYWLTAASRSATSARTISRRSCSLRRRRSASAAPRPATVPATCGLLAAARRSARSTASALSIAPSAERSASTAVMSRALSASRSARRSCARTSPPEESSGMRECALPTIRPGPNPARKKDNRLPPRPTGTVRCKRTASCSTAMRYIACSRTPVRLYEGGGTEPTTCGLAYGGGTTGLGREPGENPQYFADRRSCRARRAAGSARRLRAARRPGLQARELSSPAALRGTA